MDYFVPNFGKDNDIHHSQHSEKAAEQALEHEWIPQKVDGKWDLPAKDIEFKLNDDDKYPVFDFSQVTDNSLAQLSAESDPICPSSGCPKTEEEKKEPPVVYNMYPIDNDIHDLIMKQNIQKNNTESGTQIQTSIGTK